MTKSYLAVHFLESNVISCYLETTHNAFPENPSTPPINFEAFRSQMINHSEDHCTPEGKCLKSGFELEVAVQGHRES